jgi:fringe-like protein
LQEDQIGGHHIIDALSRVSPEIRAKGSDFQIYRDQLSCPLSQEDCNHGLGTDRDGKSAWTLDKYKFIHMLVQTWELRPNREWYVFAEADTYLFWPNLVKWIRRYASHEKTPYVGNVALVKGYPFAHGGSGYVISGKLLKNLVESDPDLEEKGDQWANETCCGDVLVAKSVAEVGARVGSMSPMMDKETVTDVRYGPGRFCEPMLSLHHVWPEQVNQLWEFEQRRENRV